MSGKSRRKKDGRRKEKRLHAMRSSELQKHLESGHGYSPPRGSPHIGHTSIREDTNFRPHQGGLGRVWLGKHGAKA